MQQVILEALQAAQTGDQVGDQVGDQAGDQVAQLLATMQAELKTTIELMAEMGFSFLGHEHTKITNGIPERWERKTLSKLANITMG